MAHRLSNKHMEQRLALFDFWYLGFCAVSKESDPDKPSTIAQAMFCVFIRLEHPYLRLNNEETAMTDCFDLEKAMPSRLKEELWPKVRITASETRISSDLLRAAAYGCTLAKLDESNLTAESVMQNVMKAIHASFEKDLADAPSRP